MGSAWSQAFPPYATWDVDDIPDLTGRVAVVTGGYSGIGTHTVKALLAHNAKVYVAGRDEAKATKTLAALKAETGKEAHFLKLDLASLQSVKVAAEELAGKEQAIHILFNNAGVLSPPIEQLTTEGYDLQWGTNVLGHFYFTHQLLPLLRAGVTSSPDGKVRVINTASSGADTGKVDFSTFRESPTRQKVGSWPGLYSQSKLGNVLISNEFARRYGPDGIISVSLNPGNLQTELGRNLSPFVLFLVRRIVYPAHLGALTQLWAGTSSDGLEMNGKYLWPWAREGQMPVPAQDVKLQEEVWAWCEEQVKNL